MTGGIGGGETLAPLGNEARVGAVEQDGDDLARELAKEAVRLMGLDVGHGAVPITFRV